MTLRRMGIEEELLLVEPETGQSQAVAATVLEAAAQAAAGLGHDRGTGEAEDGTVQGAGFRVATAAGGNHYAAVPRAR
jgi:hypothetical protein